MSLPVAPYDEWFDPNYKYNPLDTMPIATNDEYDPPCSYEPQDESDDIENTKSMHQKMYEIATAKYNPFAIGGSESIHDFEGGSENHVK